MRERATACIRAIVAGVVDDDAPSRRQRLKVLAVDREDDVAAVLIASGAKRRNLSLDIRVFVELGGSWRSVGGGGQVTADPRLPDRSSVPARSIETAQTHASGRGRSAIRASAVRAGRDIAVLRWRRRDRPVSPTGYAVVVWRGRRPPEVTGYDAAGALVAQLDRPAVPSSFEDLSWIEFPTAR
jgi:hypothetical protein